MDLIGTLSSQLGLDPNQAAALAGSVIGGVRGQVAKEAGPETAKQMDAAIPELSGWQDTAASMFGGGDDGPGGAGGFLDLASGALGGLGGMMGGDSAAGGLLGAAAGALGSQQAKQTAALVGVLDKLGRDASHAAMIAPVALGFLKERLPDGLLDTVLSAAPFLTGGGGDSSGGGGGGIAGALGGLLGG